MAKSSKGDNKSARNSEDKKSKNKSDKTNDFKIEIIVVNQGKVPRGTKISRESVKKHSSPSKANAKAKSSPVKFYKNQAEFKEKVILGNKKKKVLEYGQIKMIEQLQPDGDAAFVHYEGQKDDYFFVLKMKDASKVKRFIDLVKEENSKAEIRWIEAKAASESGESDEGVTEVPPEVKSEKDSMIGTYDEEPQQFYPPRSVAGERRSDSALSRSPSPLERPWTTTSSFICADPYMDDGSVYSRGSPETVNTRMNTPPRRSRRRDSYSTYNEPMRPFRSNGLTTQYHGPSDDEDSYLKDKYRHKSKKSHHSSRRQPSGFEDDESISIAPSFIMTEVEYDTPEVYKQSKTANYRRPPSSKGSTGRRTTHRSKSRELPLSEAEKNQGSWHSDLIYVTPTKDGGVKVSDFGPVALYSATRTNGNADYDSDDSTSDGDSDFSYSSGSTLTLEDPAMPNPYGFNYPMGHR